MNPGRSCVKTPHDRVVRPNFTPINPSTAVSYLPGLPGKILNSESRYAYFCNRYPTLKPTPGASTRQPLQASQSIGKLANVNCTPRLQRGSSFHGGLVSAR